jgi:hypothetical protein
VGVAEATTGVGAKREREWHRQAQPEGSAVCLSLTPHDKRGVKAGIDRMALGCEERKMLSLARNVAAIAVGGNQWRATPR